jgi:hypothetical protein
MCLVGCFAILCQFTIIQPSFYGDCTFVKHYEQKIMSQNIEIIKMAMRLIVKAAVLAAGFSGRVRERSLKRLAWMDIDEKDGSSHKFVQKNLI